MTVHLVHLLHLPHPSRSQIRHAADRAAGVASAAGWVCAGVTAVAYVGPQVVAGTVLLGAGYAAGAYRTGRRWSARHTAVLAGVNRVNEEIQRNAARELAKLSAYAAADREPHRARRDKHLNSSYARKGTPKPERNTR